MTHKFSVLFCFALSALSFWNCDPAKKPAESPSQEINELPYLAYHTLTGEPSSTRSLPGGSILILFNTDCDHCQREANEIADKPEAFKNYELLFIASDSIHQIENFAKTYKLDNKTNVKFGRAEYQDVYTNFGSISTPAIYIYNRERKFVRSFLGETPVEELIKYL